MGPWTRGSFTDSIHPNNVSSDSDGRVAKIRVRLRLRHRNLRDSSCVRDGRSKCCINVASAGIISLSLFLTAFKQEPAHFSSHFTFYFIFANFSISATFDWQHAPLFAIWTLLPVISSHLIAQGSWNRSKTLAKPWLFERKTWPKRRRWAFGMSWLRLTTWSAAYGQGKFGHVATFWLLRNILSLVLGKQTSRSANSAWWLK